MGSDFQFDPDTGLPVSAPDQGFQFDPDTGLPVSSSAAQTQPQASAPAAQPDWWEDYWGPLKDHASQAYRDSLAGNPASMPATDPITAKGLLDGRQALQQEIFAGSDPEADGESKQAAALAATRLAKIDHVLGMMGNQSGELATGVTKPGDIIDSLTHDKLMASDRYRQVYESAAPVLGPEKAADYAKDTVAKDAHFIPYMSDSIFSDLLGAPKATAFDKNYRGEVPTGEPGFSSETSLDFGTGGGQLDTSGVGPALATVGHQIAEATPRMLAGGEASLIKFGANVAPALIGATGNIAGAQALEQELAPTVKQATAVQQEVGQESAEAKKAGETSPISRFVEAFGGALYQLPEYSIAPEIEGSQIAIAAVKALPASYSAAVDKFNELEPKVGYVQALAAAGLDGVLNEVAGSLPMGAGSLLKQVISGGATGVASNVVGTVGQNLILANHPELHQELDPEEVMRSGLTMAGLPAVMHVMHLPNAKLINDRLDESAMHAAATNDLAKFARISYVADQVESGRSSLWAAAELNNIDHAGQVRDETGFQLWVGAKKAARSAAEVEQPTAAETAPGEGEQTMEAAQAIVGSPNAPSTEIHPLPVPEQPLPPDEHPDAQVPAPSTTLGEDLRATVAPPQPTAVPDKQVEIDAAYAQRQQAEQRTRDEQLATAAPDLERLGLSEQDQRLEREHAAARAAGMEEEPPPTAMALAMQNAKRMPRPEPPAPEPLVEGTVTGGEAPAATGGPTIEGFRPQAEEPSSTGFKLSDQAMAKGAEVPSKPSFRMAEPVGDNGIPTDLPVEKTDASDALERSINYHFTEPGQPQASFAEVRPDSVPHPLSEVLNAVQDFTGTKVSIIRDVGPKVTARWNGMTLREGTLYVNEGTNQPVVHILSHEWTHQLRADAPHLYQQLEDEVNRQGWVDAYAKKFGLNKADALEELTADATGDAMGDPKFLDRMAKENPTVFGRIATAFKNFLGKFLTKYPDLGSHNYMSDAAAFRDKLADVLHQHAAERAVREGAPGEPAFRARPEEPGVSEDEISTRNPTAKKATENPITDRLHVGLESASKDPEALAHNVGLMRQYPEFGSKATHEEIISHMARNLTWLHDQVPADIRARAHLWYDGANHIAQRLADQYGMERRGVSGVMAALSPQKDWFMNASLGHRVIDTLSNHAHDHWSPEMERTAQRIFGKEQYAPDLAEIRGKQLADISDPYLRSMWVRTYDEAHNPRDYQVIHPEGDYGEFAKTGAGERRKVAWGSLGEASKAVSIFDNPSRENISMMLGDQHKVRSFYNNIESPNSPNGHTTIDTHAVAAAHLRPLSGTKNSSITGNQGTYGLYHEAYQRAAAARGILPREMQSITWEGIRSLFPAALKRNPKIVAEAHQTWDNFRKGRITENEARDHILQLAGGIRNPEWLSSARPDEGPGAAADAGELSQPEFPRRGTEQTVSGAGERTAASVPEPAFRLAGGADEGELQDAARVRGGERVLPVSHREAAQDGRREPDGSLLGLPRNVGGGFKPSVSPEAARVADDYMRSRGEEYSPPNAFAKVDPDRATRIAQAYDAMEHAPNDPAVKRAYGALIKETLAQYQAIKESGLKVDFIDPSKGDPYEGNPRKMIDDVRDNNHMYVFSTRDGFGSDAKFDASQNPLLGDSGEKISGQPAMHNDLFRVVHDYFGHVKEGVGFRADGEENAWRAHRAMFSPEARAAMTSETRGQNSWVNYGPHAEQNRKASGADTIYADQKIGILPDWAQNEGAGVEPPKPAFARAPAEENVAPHSAENEDGAPVKTVKSSIGNLHIETAAGETRTGTAENGKPFSRVMKHDYGYIEGVPGRDGGSMDVLLGEGAHNPMLPVFVVHQKNNAGGFDEHKVLVGFRNQRDAERAYLSEYPKGWDKMGQVEQFSAAGFKQWARTEGREQAQLGKVDASVPRVNIRGQQPDAVAAFGSTDSPMPQRTANEDGRMDLPNAVKGIASRTVFDPAEAGGKHQAVLRNLYDVKADPRGLADMARDTLEAHGLPLDLPHMMNEYERLVIAHGFDGYKTSDGKATVLGAKVPMRATEEKTSGLATARPESAAGRITERADENAGRDNAPRGEGETTNRANGPEGDNQAAAGKEAGQGVRVSDGSPRAAAHPGVATERTSIKNEETEAIGKGPIERIGGKTADELEAGARRAILKNPELGRTLAAEVAKSPRNISDHEAAVLAVDRQRIVQEHDAATKRAVEAIDANDETTAAAARVAMKLHEDDLETNRRATVHAGTEWSNSGRARQMFVEPDESFAGLLDARKAAAGKSVLSAGERAEIQAHADEIARLKAQVETPGLAEKPPMVAKAAKVKFDDALAQFKKIQQDKLMTKECYL